MPTPSTTIYVRPGWASYTWTYAGTTMPSGAATSAVTAVAFDIDSASGQQLTRGQLYYSLDNGKNWQLYNLPVDGPGAYVSAAGSLWRFIDRTSGDYSTPNTFGAHYQLANGSVVNSDNTVIIDNPPSSLAGENHTMFSTLQAGAVVDLLSSVDSGSTVGGRWVIDAQSQSGLFAIDYNPAVDTGARLVIANPAMLPATDMAASVTIHYYDRYQLDTNGNPIAGQGVTRTLVYTVEDGSTRDLAGFGDEAKLGAATHAGAANPSLAALSSGGFVAVWQGSDTVAGGAGAGLWAQLRDAAGNASGSTFALTPNGDARIEGEPAVAALAGGRFVVVYSVNDGGATRIAYRVVEANGSAGAEHVLDGGASGDAAMPAVATLADGSFAIGWRSGGAVHVQQAAALDGATIGAQRDYGALSSAFSPSLAALKGGGYVVSWGEINDGNVYAATSANGAPFVVNGDGDAASLATAAPLPHVTTLANGNFVIAWDSYVNEPLGFSTCDIFFQLYDGSGHALGRAVQANLASGGGRYDAAVSALSDGGFVVAWQSQTGDYEGSGVFGRRFGADGSAVDLQEFQVNQLRAGDQSGPEVVALANGGFATTWVDTPASGNNVTVETRVYLGAGGSTPLQSGSETSNAGNAAGDPSGANGTPVVAPVSSAPAAPAPVVPAPMPSAPAAPVPVLPAPVASSPSAGMHGAAAAQALATAGNNVLSASAGGFLDGKDGLDTAVFGGQRAAYTLSQDASGVTVTDSASGIKSLLANVERLQFGDQTVALDVNGNAGEAYRLYQAAFDRTPDKGGLGYWIDALDQGASLKTVANAFVDSAEFAQKYGSNTDDAHFLSALYQNVLHRAPDPSGYAFWLDSLRVTSRAQVLADFSESAENKSQVSGAIQNGIAYAAVLNGNAGNNVMAASTGGVMDGKEGIDTVVFGGMRAAYALSHDAVGVTVRDTVSGAKTALANVERLQFGDQAVALDVHGNGGEAYRLYQAAFARTPDKGGLGFWIATMDKGQSLVDVAANFIHSQEFADKLGADASDAGFLTALYQNVLHRAPDASGYAFWLDALHTTSRAQVLVDFSESTENQAQVIGTIQDGFAYTPWAG